MEVLVIEKEVFQEAFNELSALTDSLQQFISAYPIGKEKEKWLDAQEVCQLLGINKRTLQNYKDKGILASSSIFRKNYFKFAEVQQLLSTGTSHLKHQSNVKQ